MASPSAEDKDFEKKSQYVQPEEKYGIQSVDNDEDRYKYINDEVFRDAYISSIESSGEAAMASVGYEYMTDEEKKQYNYYYNSGDKKKAREYLKTITESLGARKSVADYESYKGNTAKELLFGVNAGLDQFAQGIKNVFNSNDEYIPVNATQQLSGMIRDDLNYEHGNWGKVPYDFVTTTSNMLPSILTSTLIGKVNPGLGAKVGSALMGASAGGNAYQEMVNLGYDPKQARAYALLVGVSESSLQNMMGGIGKLGGVGGKLSTAIKSIDNAFARFAINYGGSMVAEGIEEATQEVLNPIFKNLAAGYDTGEKIDWGEVVYSGLLGAMSGGLWEGRPAISNARAEVNTGKSLKANERVSEMFDLANNSEIAEAYETYTRYANKGITAENVSNAQLGRLYNEVKADAVEKINSKKSTDEQRASGLETLGKLGLMKTENKVAKEKSKLNVGEESKVTETGEAIDIKSLTVKGEDVVLSTEKGEVSTDKITLTNTDADLVAHAKVIARTDGEDIANLFLSQYDGKMDIDEYENSFNLTVAYGKNDFSFKTILENKGKLTTDQVNAIYAETRIKADKENREAIKRLNEEMADGKFYKGFINESVINYGEEDVEGKVKWTSLTERQRQAVTFIKGFAQATGMNLILKHNPKSNEGGAYNITRNTITIDISSYENSAKVLVETIIPTMSHETTHWMKKKSPELWRNLNEIVFSTLTDHYNSNTEKAIKDKIELLKWVEPRVEHTEESVRERKITEEDLIQAEMNINGESESVSREEIIARACEDILSMSEQGRKIFRSLSESEQKTLVEKIKAIINDLLNWVDNLLNSYKATSKEAQIMREYKDELQKAVKIWDKMLEESVVANQTFEKSGAYNHDGNAEDVMYSIRKEYIKEIESWQKNGMPNGETFILGTTGDVLQGLGAIESDIYMLSKKINEILNDHPEMTIDEIKKIPQILENPILILKSKNVGRNDADNSRLVIFGNIKAKDGRPILSVLDLKPIENNLTITDMQKVSSAYTKDVKPVDFIKESLVVYADKKRTTKLLRTIGFKAPIELQLSGYIGIISYLGQNVNIKGKEFSKVFRESNVRFSKRDSNGKELSEEQIEYFKDSVMRDEEGNLLVMYRGDSNEFTVFDRKKTNYSNLYGRGFYFTKNKSHAEQYGKSREFYLNIKNPLSPKQNAITKVQMHNFLKAIENNGEDYDLYNYGQDATAESVLNSVWGKGDFEMLQDISAGAIGDLVAAVELFNEVNGTTYDGIVLPTETVTFNSEQAKLTSNVTPTKNEDIRYSKRDTEYVELAKDPAKNEARLREMVDEIAEEKGYNVKAYHGTPNNDFTVFDKNRVGKGTDQYGAGFYFASNKDAARAYGARVIDSRLSLNNPIKIDGSSEEGANLIDAGFDYLLTEEQAYEVIKRLPNIYDAEESILGDYYDSYWENGAEDWMIEDLASSEFNRNIGYLDSDLFRNYPNELHEAIRDVVGYDGIEVAFANGDKFYVVWFDNQMKSAELVTYDDDGNIIPLSKRFNPENEDIRYSKRDYSYETLISKPDMKITVLDNDVPNNRADIIYEAKKKAAKIGKVNTKDKTVSVFVDDIEKDILIGTDGLKHSMNRGKGLQNKPIGIVTLNVGEIIKNSIRINELTPSKETAKGSYVLIGASKDTNNNLYLVRFVVNEYNNELTSLDVLYAINTKKESAMLNASRYANDSLSETDSTISIAKLLDFVNKYFPDILPESVLRHYGYDARPDGELGEDVLFSRRDTSSIFDIMGETERVLKENEKLKADIERLKELRNLEKKVTHGKELNNNQILSAAAHLRNISKSDIDKVELAKSLKGLYSFINQAEHLTWEEVYGKSYSIAEEMLKESRPEVVINDYSKHILREIKNQRISLSEAQKKEAGYIFGKNWNRNFFGKVVITDDAISLERQWQEWATEYPDIFKSNISDTDMIVELYDIIGSLQDASETIVEYDMLERTRWLANEIYNQYWNVSPIRTTADKYDKQIKMLKAEHKRMMSELREDRDTRLKEQHKVDKEKYNKLVKDLRERKDKQIALAKQHGEERLSKYKENAERKTYIQRITANALSLNDMLKKNSKDKHVPEIMREPVTALLQAIDFSSKRMLDNGLPTHKDISLSKALSKVKDMMVKATNAHDELVELYGHGLDEDIEKMVDDVDNIMRDVGDNEFVLNKMTLTDLQTLEKTVKTIKHAVNKLNKFHIVNHAKGIANLSQESVLYLDSLGKGKVYDGIRGVAKKLLNWNNALPYYVFKRFGDGGKKVYEALQDGWDKFAFNVKKIIDFTNNVYTSKEVKEWSEEVKTFKILIPATEMDMSRDDYIPQYQEVQLTVPQIMSMYCLNKREQARGHLFQGGIRVADFKDAKGNIVSQSEGIIFTEKDVQTIFDSLTERQIEVADKLQEFMNTICADWGNDVSMARFGYKAFGEENYFPIQSDKNNLAVNDETEQQNSLFRLLNMSFTKSTLGNANNRIVISDIFDVFAQHTSDMAKYNALALPVLDSFKWYNYTEKENIAEGTFKTSGVKQSIEKAFGKDGQSYFTTFLKDINGTQETDREQLSKSFMRNYKIASVGANLRVIALQPTSYVRASAVIDNKYLVKALGHKPKVNKAETHCGIALWKSMGYFDTNIQRGVTDQIKHDETFRDKVTDLSMKGAEMADKLTWGYLWNACELEIRETRKDLKVGSDEFYTEIGKRLREVIYATQVVDSTMTRSQMMRSTKMHDQIMTNFASEPTLAYNMLQDAYMEYALDARKMGKKEAFKKNGKRIGRILTAYTMTNAIAALVESGFDAFRDDDDEEEMDMIAFMKLYLGNFASDMSITGKIPYIKEIHSLIKGYSVSRSELAWAESSYKAITGIYKNIQGKGNPATTLKNTLKSISYLSSLPFYNVYRDAMATLNKLDIFTEEDLNEMFEDFLD